MIQTQRNFNHSDIFKFIGENEPEKALALIDNKINIEEDLEEKCWLYIYQSWIYYALYMYYPLTHNSVNLVLKHREELSNYIVAEAYIIRALAHIKQKKYLYALDSAEICLKIDANNTTAKKLYELILLLLKK